jgi:hypothetical protein
MQLAIFGATGRNGALLLEQALQAVWVPETAVWFERV